MACCHVPLLSCQYAFKHLFLFFKLVGGWDVKLAVIWHWCFASVHLHSLKKERKKTVHFFDILFFNLVLMNQMEWSMVPAFPVVSKHGA